MSILKKIICKYFANLIYPTNQYDWYEKKGYSGNSHQEKFSDFLKKQQQPDSIYYKEFKSLKLTREFVPFYGLEVDSVTVHPSKVLSKNKPGNGLYIVCFQGKSEYYENRFRDMALFSRKTGATIIGFNPAGKIRVLSDIAQNGIAIIDHLLAKNINPSQIILYGNSLGSAIQEMVCAHFRKSKQIDFRQINSNSFRSISAVIATKLKIPYLEQKLYRLMLLVGWEIIYDDDFYTTGVHRCYLIRKNDKTIKLNDSFYSKINLSQDIIKAPYGYRETLQWLSDNAELVCLDHGGEDVHTLSLYRFHIKNTHDEERSLTIWDFINKYLEASNKFIGHI